MTIDELIERYGKTIEEDDGHPDYWIGYKDASIEIVLDLKALKEEATDTKEVEMPQQHCSNWDWDAFGYACAKCGKLIEDGSNYCPGCGKKIKRIE